MRHFSIFLLVLGLAVSLSARPRNHDAAVSILGQPNFTSAVSSDPPTARSLRNVEGVAIDPTTGKLFVADSDNHRILRFSSVAAYQTHAAAEAVFGQPDFESNAPNRDGGPAADSLDYPATLAIDQGGRLWVCDYNNSRVLRFDGASSKPSFTAAADAVIGQSDFDSNDFPASDSEPRGFVLPTGIAVGNDGTLWVSDATLFRILRFDNAASLPAHHDEAADGYLGAIEGGVFVSGTSDSAFQSDLWGLAIGPQGHLWVADSSNHRVLCFFDPVNKASADLVLGQVDFDSDDLPFPPSASSLNKPYYVTVAPDGTAWVSDYANNRVLGFYDAANRANGDAADLVLGRPDFESQDEGGGYNARKTISPTQIAVGREGSLFIGEYSEGGQVKRWSDPVTLTARKAQRTSKRGVAVLRGRSAGAVKVEYRVPRQGPFRRARGSTVAWSARVARLSRRITPVTVRATAFDGRTAVARVRVIKRR